jgi:hypothetical protein
MISITSRSGRKAALEKLYADILQLRSEYENAPPDQAKAFLKRAELTDKAVSAIRLVQAEDRLSMYFINVIVSLVVSSVGTTVVLFVRSAFGSN